MDEGGGGGERRLGRDGGEANHKERKQKEDGGKVSKIGKEGDFDGGLQYHPQVVTLHNWGQKKPTRPQLWGEIMDKGNQLREWKRKKKKRRFVTQEGLNARCRQEERARNRR